METRITSQRNRNYSRILKYPKTHTTVFLEELQGQKTDKGRHSSRFFCVVSIIQPMPRKKEKEREIYEGKKSLSLHPRLFSAPDEKPFCWLIGEWCCYLESRSIRLKEREEKASEGFLPRVQLCWWVSCQTPHCPNYPASMVSPPGTNLQRHATIPLWRWAPGRPYGDETFTPERRDSERLRFTDGVDNKSLQPVSENTNTLMCSQGRNFEGILKEFFYSTNLRK